MDAIVVAHPDSWEWRDEQFQLAARPVVLAGRRWRVVGLLFGLPGRGEFIPAVWLAAFVATLIAPGWPGLVALIAGVAVVEAILDISDGTFGIAWLIVAILTALAAHAALAASVLLRLRALGWAAGLRDSRVLGGATLVVGLVLIFVWLANDLARNPA